jgi:hypothetical protein
MKTFITCTALSALAAARRRNRAISRRRRAGREQHSHPLT